jgi:hypothetical protein
MNLLANLCRCALLLGALQACDALGSIASGGVDFAGAKAGAYCDRRFVTQGGQAAAFCQEIASTVAAAEFTDDCRTKHLATAGAGECPREHVIAGCQLSEHHDDKSVVTDWYYDVSEPLAEAGASAGPDGGPTFESVEHTVDDVAATCADATRYENGATLVMP